MPASDALFDAAVAIVVAVEGSQSCDPRDPGGATKFGISAAAHPGLDIAGLTLADAKAIYRRDYWDKNRCGEMPWPFALTLFDGAVNQGSVVPLLQRAVRLPEDGAIGPATLAALAEAGADHLDDFLALRALRYAASQGFAAFGRGWLKRLFRIAAAAGRPPGS